MNLPNTCADCGALFFETACPHCLSATQRTSWMGIPMPDKGGHILCDDVPWPTNLSHVEIPIPPGPSMIFTGDRTPRCDSSPMPSMVFRQAQLLNDGKPGKWAWERIA